MLCEVTVNCLRGIIYHLLIECHDSFRRQTVVHIQVNALNNEPILSKKSPLFSYPSWCEYSISK